MIKLTYSPSTKYNPRIGDKIIITKITENFERNKFIGKKGNIVRIKEIYGCKRVLVETTITSKYYFHTKEIKQII